MKKGIILLLIVSLLGVGVYKFAAQLKPPQLVEISSDWGEITRATTVINTEVVIDNPNPISIPIKLIEYEIYMNDIRMAEGQSQGDIVIKGKDRTIIKLKSILNNELLPRWWASHIDNGETTRIRLEGNVVFDLKGVEFKYPFKEEREIKTNILGGV